MGAARHCPMVRNRTMLPSQQVWRVEAVHAVVHSDVRYEMCCSVIEYKVNATSRYGSAEPIASVFQ